MAYTVTKKITPRKKHPLKGVIPVIILICAVPVIVIALISLLLYFGYMWIRGKILKEKPAEPEHYHFETVLVKNQFICITMVEDEWDEELTACNEAWKTNVYDEQTCLYRAATIPQVRELEGKIVCYYLKEQTDGVIMQVLNPSSDKLATQLFYVEYQALNVSFIDHVGPFFLYNDEADPRLIKGFNKNERIEILIN